MTSNTKPTAKQSAVLDALFEGVLGLDDVLRKHKVPRATFSRWLADERFVGEFERRIEWLSLQSRAIIARYSALAAAKLVQLTESQSQETARKACLDVISLPRSFAAETRTAVNQTRAEPVEQGLSPQIAGRILAALADEDTDSKSTD